MPSPIHVRMIIQTLRRLAVFLGLMIGAQQFALADNYTQTRYPVVLVHGLFGYSSLLGSDYFFGIPAQLRAGGAIVYTPTVSAANSNEERGEQLLKYLLSLQAAYGYKKFNLIGHSQGGTTARYVAGVRPDLVASVTSVSTPHAGSKTADALAPVIALPVIGPFATSLVNGFASFLTGDSAKPQNILAALGSLTTAGAATFNQKFPQAAPTTACGAGAPVVNGISYFSLGGATVLTNVFDLSDFVLGLSSVAFAFAPNDGLVGQCSSHWGTVLKDNYSWNHLDANNQLFGLRGLFSEDPIAVYRGQVNRLKLTGL